VKAFILLSVCCLPGLVLAAQSGPAGVPSPGASIAQMMLGLGITLAMLFAALHFLRRLQGARGVHAGALRMLGGTSVGTRERVVLLAVGEDVLVLGVTPSQISTLHKLPLSALPTSEPTPAPVGEFATRLREFMARGKNGQ
jgi:flagellar protein FliO/FliZ